MSESREHMEIVEHIRSYVSNILDENERLSIVVDSPDSPYKPKRVIGNFTPDLLYIDNHKLIIGEAKTDGDVETTHSVGQYRSYIQECAVFKGKSLLVFGVNYYGYNTLKKIITNLKKDEKYLGDIIILDMLGRVSFV